MIPQEVTCTITGCKHTVVYGNTNYKKLKEWVKDALYRMDFGEKIILALDCEGFCLGSRKDSLGLIQFAECFTKDFFKNTNTVTTPVSINLKNGFLVKAPMTNGVKQLLSSVFNHKNIMFATYDFTSDITAMLESGLRINLRGIVDGQATETFDENDLTKYFSRASSTSLKVACSQANNCVEYNNASYAINHKNSIPFSQLVYDLKNEKDPFACMCTSEFWRYSSDDIALTAIAIVSAIQVISPHQLFINSQAKVRGFKQLNQQYGDHGAVFKRRLSFAPKIDDIIDSKIAAYKIWSAISYFIENYNLYVDCVDEPYSQDKLKSYLNEAEKWLQTSQCIFV